MMRARSASSPSPPAPLRATVPLSAPDTSARRRRIAFSILSPDGSSDDDDSAAGAPPETSPLSPAGGARALDVEGGTPPRAALGTPAAPAPPFRERVLDEFYMWEPGDRATVALLMRGMPLPVTFGFPGTDGGVWSNLREFVGLFHPFVSIFRVHPLCPFSAKERLVVFFCSVAFNFLWTAFTEHHRAALVDRDRNQLERTSVEIKMFRIRSRWSIWDEFGERDHSQTSGDLRSREAHSVSRNEPKRPHFERARAL